MRFHVVGLPHTQTTREYESCAFTSNVRMFATMMFDLGHEVFLYASEENEAECTELIPCITKIEQAVFGFCNPEDALKLDYSNDPVWSVFNAKVIAEIAQRIQPHDIICLITGDPAAYPICSAFPNNITCEYAVGYKGAMRQSKTHHRVFCSRSWQHYVYGKHNSEGFFFDDVIPHYFEVDDYPKGNGTGGYYLFVGRLNAWKGLDVAQEVCQALDVPLIVAGQGYFEGYGDYIGRITSEQRGQLMGDAIALFAPTLYIEPFGKVVVEAMLTGTPVITTDFGAFPEIIQPGVNGYRAKSFPEFKKAAEDVKWLKRDRIRKYAIANYSTTVIAKQYEAYFIRLQNLFGPGWYG